MPSFCTWSHTAMASTAAVASKSRAPCEPGMPAGNSACSDAGSDPDASTLSMAIFNGSGMSNAIGVDSRLSRKRAPISSQCGRASFSRRAYSVRSLCLAIRRPPPTERLRTEPVLALRGRGVRHHGDSVPLERDLAAAPAPDHLIAGPLVYFEQDVAVRQSLIEPAHRKGLHLVAQVH